MILTEAEETLAGADDEASALLARIAERIGDAQGPLNLPLEAPEHADCPDRPARAPVKPHAKKLSFCLDCTLLTVIKAGAQKDAPLAEYALPSEAV